MPVAVVAGRGDLVGMTRGGEVVAGVVGQLGLSRSRRDRGRGEEGLIAFSFYNSGVCLSKLCQVSSLQSGPTCQKVIK